MLLDDVQLSAASKMSLLVKLAKLVKEVTNESNTIKKMRDLIDIKKILQQLGVTIQANNGEAVRVEEDNYEYNAKVTLTQRKKNNKAAVELLRAIQSEGRKATAEEKKILAKYSGNGGGLVGDDGLKGSAYEYYTPKPVTQAMWDVLEELGFKGGKVLDPSAGTGIFAGTAPKNAVITQVELDSVSGSINALINDQSETIVSPFEAVAANTPDGEYDAIITNVPFGSVTDRGGNQLLDKKYRKEPLQNYFILRSLEKLKPGGLAAFITPPRCISGKGGKEAELRMATSTMAEFIGAFRLPNSVFGAASADTITDVIFYRKYSEEVLEKVEELKQQDAGILAQANVMWDPYLSGDYFKEEGKKFVLGEFVPKNPNKIRDVDRVVNPLAVPEVAKLMKKLPHSRISWELLETTETLPIAYMDGDCITRAGVTYEYRNGLFVELAQTEGQKDILELGTKLANPYNAFLSKITHKQAEEYHDYLVSNGMSLDIPGWLRMALKEKAANWNTVIVALSVADILKDPTHENGFNYFENYSEISNEMKYHAKSRFKAVDGEIRSAVKQLVIHYNAGEYSNIWRGNVLAEVNVEHLSEIAGFEGLKYKNKSPWVSIEDAKTVLGENFDPFESDEWCISADGLSVIKTTDYYAGSLSKFYQKIDAQIDAATDEKTKKKLLSQKMNAFNHVQRADVKKLTFNLFSPYVTAEEKAEFLRIYVDPSAHVAYDDETGQKRPDIDISKSNMTDMDKIKNRFGAYLKNGTITLGNIKVSMGDAEALAELKKMAARANEQFNSWVKAKRNIMDRIEVTANDPSILRFRSVEEDSSLLEVPGLSPKLKLHAYQSAFVREQGKTFGGGNSFGVGLGKTFTALASVQYVQSIGVKKKTVFVVPNSVLSNWRKEAMTAYTSIDDCLFVGLRIDKKGKAKVNANLVDEDLLLIKENRHAKIFMTLEHLARLKLKDETIRDYESYMRRVDSSYAQSQDRKTEESNKSKISGIKAILSDKTGSAPYFEDLGIDSIVIDEAHAFKNAAETVDFKSAKFLSLTEASKRGVDAQAKAWYVRGGSELNDGVLLLTATPITNSPLEIYSMLTLAVGHEAVNNDFLSIRGADDFMNTVCRKVQQSEVTIDGIAKEVDVFVGLENGSLISRAITGVFKMKSAEDVGHSIVVPEQETLEHRIDLPDEIKEKLRLYKKAFRYAINEKTGKRTSDESELEEQIEAFNQVQDSLQEPMELIGHPFNLISKMTMIIADPELERRATFFIVSDKEKAKKVIEEFNAKKFKEDRSRPGPLTPSSAIVSKKTKKDGDDLVELIVVEVRSGLIEKDNKIWIDTVQSTTQDAFIKLAEKHGLELDVTIPPKIAALLENYTKEMANPRGIKSDGSTSTIVKQIVFCDVLALHVKIKIALNKRAGVSSSKIAIITGRTNNSPDEIIDVQNGFNEEDEAENRYQAIIANEKAEVGINLQKGTQAIHHLTIGWTPDSLTQRNGRGVRQGNATSVVRVYYYDADGTFDSFKRTMVGKKSEWIDQVTKGESNSIDIAGGLTNEQIEALIDVVGDNEAIARVQKEAFDRETEKRVRANVERQMHNMDAIIKGFSYLEDNKDHNKIIKGIMRTLAVYRGEMKKLNDRINREGASESAIEKNKKRLAEIEDRYSEIEKELDDSIVHIYDRYAGSYKDVESFMIENEDSFKTYTDLKIIDTLRWVGGELKQGSVLYQKWAEDIEATEKIIEESINNAVEQSKMSGTIPEQTIRRAAKSRIMALNGKMIIGGCFVLFNDFFACVKRKDIRPGNNSLNLDRYDQAGARESIQMDAFKLLREAKIILPGADDYEECVIKAAKLEDAVVAKGGSAKGMFSEEVTEVLKYRNVPGDITLEIKEHTLKNSTFPFIVNDENTVLLGSIKEEQKKLGVSTSYYNSSSFSISSDKFDEVLTPYVGKNYEADFIRAIVEYSQTTKTPISYRDFQAAGISKPLEKIIPIERLIKELPAFKDAGEGRVLFSAKIKEYLPLYEFDTSMVDNLPTEFSREVSATVGALISQRIGEN